jgi:hypothetical protein
MPSRCNYQVIVPTRDSARWIAAIVEAYQRLGIQPLYLYDTRSSDDTLAVLEAEGAAVISVTPTFDRVESLLYSARNAMDTEWIIRFDDDELPSRALLNWFHRSLVRVEEPSVAFSGRNALFLEERLGYSRLKDYYFHPRCPAYLAPYWRAFRPDKVHFTDEIHTPGFGISEFATAPASAFFAHFDWILRTFDQRVAKVKRYDQQSPGTGWAFARFGLPELHTTKDLHWTPFETDEFDCLARHLAKISGPSTSRLLTTDGLASCKRELVSRQRDFERRRDELAFILDELYSFLKRIETCESELASCREKPVGLDSAMIFLHSSFRVSSTWLWSRFRKSSRVIAYFEVFSEVLVTITRDQLSSLWKYDGWHSRHPSSAGYFLELLPFIKDAGSVDKFDAAMSFTNFIPADGLRGDLRESERDYLASLIRYAEGLGKIPVISDTRSLGRLWAIKTAFPGLHILIYRNLFHQWCSYTDQLFRGDPFFMGTIRETLDASQHDPFCKCLRELYPLGKPAVDDRNYFLCFVLLHLYLYAQAADAADLIVDVNQLARDANYRLDVERQISELSSISVDLADAKDTIAYSFAMVDRHDEVIEEIKILFNDVIACTLSPRGREFACKALADFSNAYANYSSYASSLAVIAGPNGLLGERDRLLCERADLRVERDNLIAERDSVREAWHKLAADFDGLRAERDRLAADRNQLAVERAALLGSTSWRLTAPMRMVRSLLRRRPS